jgi:hypothetical protein
MVEIGDGKPSTYCLDVQVSTAAVDVSIQSGAGQSSVRRTYRVQPGRFVVPVTGDFVTVDVSADGGTPSVPAASVVAVLGQGAGSNAPLAASSADVAVSALSPGINSFPAAAGAGRVLHNRTGATATISIGAVPILEMADLATQFLLYTGPLTVTSLLGGNFTVGSLQP